MLASMLHVRSVDYASKPDHQTCPSCAVTNSPQALVSGQACVPLTLINQFSLFSWWKGGFMAFGTKMPLSS